MNTNEFKKALYREKPIAIFVNKEEGLNVYETQCSLGIVNFFIPDSEMINEDGKRIINEKMESQLLIRWMKNE